jgi:hydroxymethylpyrimidine pyrophosphatase-like HAD family hydrolase
MKSSKAIFTDIDHTLVFPAHLVPNNRADEMIELMYDSKEFGLSSMYLSESTWELIKTIQQKHWFIPTTARPACNYKRTELSKLCRYAITDNGATIIFDGQEDMEWESYIHHELTGLTDGNQLENIGPKFAQLLCDFDFCHHLHRHHYWRFDFTPESFDRLLIKNVLIPNLDSSYCFGFYGNTLFINPKIVSKSKAVQYLSTKLNLNYRIAAGDSFTDYHMLIESDYGLLSPHGELIKHGIYKHTHPHIQVLIDSGVDTSYHLLTQAIQALG